MKLQRPSLMASLRLALVAVALAIALASGGEPSRLEYATLNLRFSINRATKTLPMRAAVLLVTTDSEQRLNELYGSDWRRWYPDLVATIERAGATMVVWDATFVASEPELDAALARSFETIPVFAAESGAERNNETIRGALAGVGWKQLQVVQNMPRRTSAGTPLPPLGAVVAHALRPTVPDGARWLDFSHDPRSVPIFDIADIIRASSERAADRDRTPLSIFANRVVFVGTNLPGADRYLIPGTRGEVVPGVLTQVVCTWSYLEPRAITRVGGWIARLVVFAMAMLVVLGGMTNRRPVRVSMTAIALVIGFAGPPLVFAAWRVWLPMSAILIALIASILGVTAAHRLHLAHNYRTSLGFDPRLIEQYQTGVADYEHGVERPATVLCADVRNYTQFVTDNPPSEVQVVMTGYMAAMETIVHAHGGYINKFIGDEIVAVFGFPLNGDDSAHRAVQSARDMLEKLTELNAEWSVANLPTLDGIGVGVDTGTLRFTSIGGQHRVQFDVIGGAVNGASRLQGLTKQMGMPLIVSADVAEAQRTFPVEESVGGPEGAPETAAPANGDREPDGRHAPHQGALEFIGEVMVRGQGRRRLFGYPVGDSGTGA